MPKFPNYRSGESKFKPASMDALRVKGSLMDTAFSNMKTFDGDARFKNVPTYIKKQFKVTSAGGNYFDITKVIGAYGDITQNSYIYRLTIEQIEKASGYRLEFVFVGKNGAQGLHFVGAA